MPAALLKKLSIKVLKEFATTPSVASNNTIIATNALIATAAIITLPYCSKISFILFTSFFLKNLHKKYSLSLLAVFLSSIFSCHFSSLFPSLLVLGKACLLPLAFPHLTSLQVRSA